MTRRRKPVLNTHTKGGSEDVVADGEREWAIYTCAHGCMHIALDRVMLTLTTEEFHALQELMWRACGRFHVHANALHPGIRAH
jgi:hypothetical protein